jgi:cytochrome c peroxidase
VRRLLLAFAISILAVELSSIVSAAPGPGNGGNAPPQAAAGSLKAVPIPVPDGLGDFVANKDAVIALGKSLFWDMQVGGDGMQACASCHFQAGADVRSQNQLNPGHNGAFNIAGPNHALTAADFPFHQLANPVDPASAVTRDFDDVGGSAGVHNTLFNDVSGARRDDISVLADPTFNVGGINTRRTTGRNTPSAVNAIFNVRNFWDGRANNMFNGRSPFGAADAGARVLVANDLGEVSQVAVLLNNASTASQAVGPPNNNTEMSAAGRDWFKLGKKMLGLRPLDGQIVSNTDSRLGAMAIAGGTGLSTTYADMIRAGFQAKWWNSMQVVDGAMNVVAGKTAADHLSSAEFTQMEANFSLFWGLAVSLYEATLVSDDAPIDRFLDGDRTALTKQQQDGMGTFQGKCASCHSGAEFSDATFSAIFGGRRPTGLVQTTTLRSGVTASIDAGFHNIGVRPTADDGGVAGSDPFGNPLSQAARAGAANVVVGGSVKTPSLRNVELTGPYFHNGSASTLMQVVEFYSRGGNFQNAEQAGQITQIGKLGGADARAAVVAFLTSLTDDRVRFARAPFDHPELKLNNGSLGGEVSVLADLGIAGQAQDNIVDLPATGAAGQATPLASFLGLAPSASGAVAMTQEEVSGASRESGIGFRLMQNTPNPVFARTGTTISFSLASEGDVDLTVFDVAGRAVKTLAKGTLAAGTHSVSWNGSSDAGTKLPAGVYLYRIKTAQGQSANMKMIVQ